MIKISKLLKTESYVWLGTKEFFFHKINGWFWYLINLQTTVLNIQHETYIICFFSSDPFHLQGPPPFLANELQSKLLRPSPQFASSWSSRYRAKHFTYILSFNLQLCYEIDIIDAKKAVQEYTHLEVSTRIWTEAAKTQNIKRKAYFIGTYTNYINPIHLFYINYLATWFYDLV